MVVRFLRSMLSERIFTHVVSLQIFAYIHFYQLFIIRNSGEVLMCLLFLFPPLFSCFQLEDARIMPQRLVKGLPPLASEGTKVAPLVWIISSLDSLDRNGFHMSIFAVG
jgi:hypothetical protein